MAYRKKLIEVALPLDAINAASAHEKSIRHGHPSTLHLWWARRPLAAARAVLFAQLVDDPSAWPEQFPTEAEQEKERSRLFRVIERLVPWEASNDERVLDGARLEIARSWARAHPSERATAVLADDVSPKVVNDYLATGMPPVHDPFAGGGTIPLEAQRLGLSAIATDLNPVAVLINKATIEIPPRFTGGSPVNPAAHGEKTLLERQWRGSGGLANDVRFYGQWLRDEAIRRVGRFYPDAEISEGVAAARDDLRPLIGRRLTVMAWLWARTVKSPNPAFAHVDVPLISSFMLSTKPGKESYVTPVIEGDGYWFEVRTGVPSDYQRAKRGTKLARGNFACVMSSVPITSAHIMTEARAGRMGARLMAIVAESDRGRVYLSPTSAMEESARQVKPEWKPDVEFFQQALGFRIGNYGMTRWSDLFTNRQLATLVTLSDLIREARALVRRDALAAGMRDDDRGLEAGGKDASAYAEAVGLYLAFALSKALTRNCTQTVWYRDRDSTMAGFSRQAISMTWDFAEVNPLLEATGSIAATAAWVAEVLEGALATGGAQGRAFQANAATSVLARGREIISTDPPYYDNIGYADLSDFFYVWLRRALQDVVPNLFATVAVPKAEELVATPARHGGKQSAEKFFLRGMTEAMHRLVEQTDPAVPVTLYYAFRQSETETDGAVSTGWETFLGAAVEAGFMVTGTWPIRTEQATGLRQIGRSALASSIVLVCRLRAPDAPTATRREFRSALKAEIPAALAHLQRANIAPVDVAQAAIGPGIAIFSGFARVLEADGAPMTVRAALQLINEVLDEYLTESEGDYDADTRWAITWFEQRGYDEGPYGDAETLAKARNVAVSGIVQAGIVKSAAGKVRILKREELRPLDYDPARDERPTVWEYTQHLIRNLEHDGEGAAAALLKKLGADAETARALAYRLYNACERRKWAEEARAYNGLVIAWPELEKIAAGGRAEKKQTALDLHEDN